MSVIPTILVIQSTPIKYFHEQFIGESDDGDTWEPLSYVPKVDQNRGQGEPKTYHWSWELAIGQSKTLRSLVKGERARDYCSVDYQAVG